LKQDIAAGKRIARQEQAAAAKVATLARGLQKQKEKDTQKASQQLQDTLQASVKAPVSKKIATRLLEPPQLVVADRPKAKDQEQPVLRSGRITQQPRHLQGYEVYS